MSSFFTYVIGYIYAAFEKLKRSVALRICPSFGRWVLGLVVRRFTITSAFSMTHRRDEKLVTQIDVRIVRAWEGCRDATLVHEVL